MTPPPITEAAGLLQSGAIFPRRVGLRPSRDSDPSAKVLAGFKRGGFSLYFEDAPIGHFDLEGRWQRAFLDGTHYLKGLDATVRAVDRVREADQMILRRRTLLSGEVNALDAAIATLAANLLSDLAADSLVLMSPPPPSRPIDRADLQAILSKIVGWDAGAWADHQARYRLLYGDGPPPFLPPDCPNPVILSVGEAMSVRGFVDHARGVVSLLGRRLNQCLDVFLTGSGWIDRPEVEVLGLLTAIDDALPIQPGRGRPRASDAGEEAPRLETIHGWVEDFRRGRHSLGAWRAFRGAQLGRVTLKVDLRFPLEAEALRALVADLKAAAIGVGLACFVDAPVESTQGDFAALVALLPLASGDLISLIHAGVGGGDPVSSQPPPGGWKSRIAAVLPPKGARVVVYNPDKQWI